MKTEMKWVLHTQVASQIAAFAANSGYIYNNSYLANLMIACNDQNDTSPSATCHVSPEFLTDGELDRAKVLPFVQKHAVRIEDAPVGLDGFTRECYPTNIKEWARNDSPDLTWVNGWMQVTTETPELFTVSQVPRGTFFLEKDGLLILRDIYVRDGRTDWGAIMPTLFNNTTCLAGLR